jgi:hypothetical protein
MSRRQVDNAARKSFLTTLGDSRPQVRVRPVSVRPGEGPGQWLVTWRVQNAGGGPLRLLATWLPHGLFRCPEREAPQAGDIPPGGHLLLELPVRCQEAPGAVVENAFLILRLLWRGEPWRVLARLQVQVDRSGTPQNKVVALTAHPVGFSRSVEPGSRVKRRGG